MLENQGSERGFLLGPEAGQFRMGAKVPESAVGGCQGLFGVTYIVFHAS